MVPLVAARPFRPRALIRSPGVNVTEFIVEVVVVCVFCDEPLEHPEDLWCPGCESEEDEQEVEPAVERPLAA
jgi:hypothetical protein